MPTCPPWWLLLLLSLWEPLLRSAEAGSEGQTAGELYQRWERYRRECQETLEASEPPAGLACNGSFDMYVCWDYTAPNATARASCPWYLPWHGHVAKGFVLRQCGSDGQWGPWRDHSQCENPEKNAVFQDQRLTLERLQVVYTVGYSLSLATLLFALLILSTFRRLRCTRNYIHINLFTSFMLRAAAILTRDRLLPPPGPYPGDQVLTLWNQALAACRTAQIVTQYCVGANYTWLLVEGIYLHSLLVLVGGSEEGHFRCYMLLGWGAPTLFVIPWVIVRYLFENTQCWERNDIKAIWWIIRTPILLTILINFLIFVRILGILVSKLRTRQMRCPDYRLRLARSTLTLVPLLGVHEVVFAPVTEEQARGALRLAKLSFEIFLSSFQGFLVSVLYCFINKEVGRAAARRPRPLPAAQGMARAPPPLSAVRFQVQSEIRRGWHRCRLRHSLGEEPRQRPEPAFRTLPSGSGQGQVVAGRALCSRTLPGPGGEANHVLESYC
ncbi:gastric inhibitory polypeptide receptor isoform X1 [Bubalus bubalis]|uniref:gastric inhibitory polypeptide receptor isoform X1 n=1 Tax=Bubalus bubalis TaxID=89462 RepID=UPI000DBC808D|nr:gastric inhibitory polypeptide receptor isoform X1 [Bubalus bubalis]XP_025125125.1 gastric inhibitory polypeptide receptor isoform X1 [Bubalus bubalis]